MTDLELMERRGQAMYYRGHSEMEIQERLDTRVIISEGIVYIIEWKANQDYGW